MSKIGKREIQIPDEVDIAIKNEEITISNGNGHSLEVEMLDGVGVDIKDGITTFKLEEDTKQARSNWGTLRSLVSNAVEGLTEGFEKTLTLKGVGYRMKKEGDTLVISLGFSHPIKYVPPEGIELDLEDKTTLHIKGIDKQEVGQVAAEIRSFREVEPYKGKGFRYKGEKVRRKVGKQAVGEGEFE